MSLKNAVQFLVRAGEDPALLARLGATVRGELTRLGNAHGFDFSVAELEQALRAELGELSDEQLAHATGGVSADAPSQNLGGAAYAHQTSSLSRTKQYTAEAYRCPPRQRGTEPAPAPASPERMPPSPPDAPEPAGPDVADAGSD